MSLAGKRRGLAGEQSGALFGFLQVIEQLGERRPPLVLLENVPGFLTSHDGADFATAVDELAALGYWLDSFVIDARWFVPQSRPRLFLVGYHDELVGPPLVRRRPDADAIDDPWRQAIRRAERLRPARLMAAMEAIEPRDRLGDRRLRRRRARRATRSPISSTPATTSRGGATTKSSGTAQMMFDRHRRQMDALAAASTAPVLLTGFRRIREGQQRLEVRFDGVAGCLRTPRGGSAKQIVLMLSTAASCECGG